MATTNLGKVSVTPKGEYDPLITYERLDIISHNGSSYIVKQASTGVTPIEGDFYALIAEKGDGGSFVKKAYKTYAAMDVDKVNIPANSSVDVTNDLDESKNGAYIYDGSAFTRSQYDSKVVTDKIIADANQSVQNAIRDVAIDANLVTDALTTIVPITTIATARTQLDKNRENISILDFFTQSERAAYEASPTTFDAHRPIQEFFDYISANHVGTAYANGNFSVSKGLKFGGLSSSLSKNIVGDLTLQALTTAPIDCLMHIQVVGLHWFGELTLHGTGGVIYANRTVNTALILGNEYAANHCHFTSVTVDLGFKYVGVEMGNLTTGTRIDKIRVRRAGSGMTAARYSLESSFGNRVDFESAGTPQTTTYTVDTLPPEDVPTAIMASIEGRLYYIKSVDREAKTITTYSLVDIDVTTGTLRYVFGAGVWTHGGDASVLRIGKINATYCSIVYWSGALYAAVVDNITTQYNYAAVVLGGSPTAGHLGGQINGLYVESNDIDILKLSSYKMGMFISPTYGLNPEKIVYPYGIRSLTSNERSGNMVGVAIQIDGSVNSYEQEFIVGNIFSVDVTSKIRGAEIIAVTANATFNLEEPNLALNKAFGYCSANVTHLRRGTNPTPTSSKFVAPAGYTVNNLPEVTFSDFTGAGVYKVVLDVDYKRFIVTRLSSY